MRSFMLALLVLLPAYTVLAQEQPAQGDAQEISQQPASRLDKADALIAKELSLCRKKQENALRIEIRDTPYLSTPTTPLARFTDKMKRETDASVRSMLEDQALICYSMAVRSAVKQIAPNVAERIERIDEQLRVLRVSPYAGAYSSPSVTPPSYLGYQELSPDVPPARTTVPMDSLMDFDSPLFPTSNRRIPIYDGRTLFEGIGAIDSDFQADRVRQLDRRLSDLETQQKRARFDEIINKQPETPRWTDHPEQYPSWAQPRPVYYPPANREVLPPGTLGGKSEPLGK